jgi:CubicO group peptidase (beta-lactamase class C family)
MKKAMVKALLLMLAASFLILPGCTGTSQPETGDDPVDQWVLEWMKERNIPGLSLAVIHRGELVKIRGYGLCSVELEVPASASTVYPLASVTKSFTGAAVMLLVQEEKLSLDDPIDQHLEGLPEHWRGITVSRLLTHTSGLPEIIEGFPFELKPVANSLSGSLEILSREPMQFDTGTGWRYNQTNYVLIQALVEKLSQLSFGEFVRERLLNAAGMTGTSFGGASAVVEGRGPWYSRLELTDSGLQPGKELHILHVDYPDFMLSTGGLNSTVEDLVKWDRALRERAILSERSLQQLWAPVTLLDGEVFRLDGEVLGYALGWSTIDRRGHRAVWTSGGNTVAFHRYLDDDLSVIILTNCQGSGPNGLAEGVAGFYIPELRDDPVFLEE